MYQQNRRVHQHRNPREECGEWRQRSHPDVADGMDESHETRNSPTPLMKCNEIWRGHAHFTKTICIFELW